MNRGFVILALFGLAMSFPVCATPIVRMSTRLAPTNSELTREAAPPASLIQSTPVAATITLPAPSVNELIVHKALARDGETAIAFGRAPEDFGAVSTIEIAPGISSVRLHVQSKAAEHVRVAIEFPRDDSDYEVSAFPQGRSDLAVMLRIGRAEIAHGEPAWTPLTEGDSQEIFIQRSASHAKRWQVRVVRISHGTEALLVSGQTIDLKDLSAPCQKDIVCTYLVAPSFMLQALPLATRAVALMIMTNAQGLGFQCTGTLLNSANYPTPYFYTAHHCIRDTASAASLTTFWFYARDNCGFGPPSANTTQVAGGATVVYSNAMLDATLLVLKNSPPAMAAYSGWDASVVPSGTTILAVHHPRGDVKKGSFGNVFGINSSPVTLESLVFAAGTFYVVDWLVGIVEPGSSGSSLFTYDESSNAFYSRGTLTGGSTSCIDPSPRTYYSQLANVYPHIAGALTVPSASPPPNYQGLWWRAPAGVESGWGINLAHQGDVIFATWFTYDATGKAWWLSMSADKMAPNSFVGTLYTTTGPPWYATPFNPALVVAMPVGTGRLDFSDASNGVFSYTVNGIAQVKPITRQVFGPLPICRFGVQPNLALATNEQDLWWNDPPGSEAGWGINLTHQGNIIFATWFTYNGDGSPAWLSVTANQTAPNVYSGSLYATAGPPFYSVPFSPANVSAIAAGTATFQFINGNKAIFTNTVYSTTGPITQTKNITRQVFRSPGTVCQ